MDIRDSLLRQQQAEALDVVAQLGRRRFSQTGIQLRVQCDLGQPSLSGTARESAQRDDRVRPGIGGLDHQRQFLLRLRDIEHF